MDDIVASLEISQTTKKLFTYMAAERCFQLSCQRVTSTGWAVSWWLVFCLPRDSAVRSEDHGRILETILKDEVFVILRRWCSASGHKWPSTRTCHQAGARCWRRCRLRSASIGVGGGLRGGALPTPCLACLVGKTGGSQLELWEMCLLPLYLVDFILPCHLDLLESPLTTNWYPVS